MKHVKNCAFKWVETLRKRALNQSGANKELVNKRCDELLKILNGGKCENH